MSLHSLSLQQVQAVGALPSDTQAAEVVGVALKVQHKLDADSVRRFVDDEMQAARIPHPENEQLAQCVFVIFESDDPLSGLADKMATQLLDKSESCRVALVVQADMTSLVFVCQSWFLDESGLARFASRLINKAMLGLRAADSERDSYDAYVDWQRELVMSPEAQFGKQLWSRKCGQWRRMRELGLEEKYPATTSPQKASFASRILSPELVEMLRGCGQRYDVSEDVIVLSLWLLTLESVQPAQRQDLVVALEGAADEPFSGVVGRMALEVPLTFLLTHYTPFISLLRSVHDQLDEADEWKECFAEQHLSTDARRAAFRFGARWGVGEGIGDYRVAELLYATVNPTSRLALQYVKGASPSLMLQGDPTLYGRQTLDWLLERCKSLMVAALENPSRSLSTLIKECVKPIDMQSTPVSEPPSSTATALLDAAIRVHANDVAMTAGTRSLSYADLADRIATMAQTLSQAGVTQEQVVGVAVIDPFDRIAANLAIWRCGGAFVGLPQDLPELRRDQLVAMTGMSHFVDDGGAVQVVPSAIVKLPSASASSGLICNDKQTTHVQQLAYVIFTSGTTGEPRAVGVSQGALANQLDALTVSLPLRRGSNVLMRTPSTFDASLWEWLHPLSQGATIHALDHAVAFSPPEILSSIKERSIDMVQLTPSLLRHCLRFGGVQTLAGVPNLVVGGESLDAELLSELVTSGGTPVNVYGPAETCINASLFRVTSDRFKRTAPLGDPLTGYVFYYLDTEGFPVGVGQVGELVIGGYSLARGLVGVPGETSARFLPDPFSSHPGARMYTTGDQVRLLPNNDLEFVGRIDEQLKLNGVRIDAREVVEALRAEAAVSDAVVTLVEQPSSALIAFVVPVTANHFSAEALRRAISSKLPSTMRPSRYVAIDELPMTVHGKLDRRLLKDMATHEIDIPYVAPRTQTEHDVAECWRAVLGVERVGIHENFFLVGGHSLSFGRLIADLRSSFGIELPLSRVIAAPSVAALAKSIDEQRASSEQHEPV